MPGAFIFEDLELSNCLPQLKEFSGHQSSCSSRSTTKKSALTLQTLAPTNESAGAANNNENITKTST